MITHSTCFLIFANTKNSCFKKIVTYIFYLLCLHSSIPKDGWHVCKLMILNTILIFDFFLTRIYYCYQLYYTAIALLNLMLNPECIGLRHNLLTTILLIFTWLKTISLTPPNQAYWSHKLNKKTSKAQFEN